MTFIWFFFRFGFDTKLVQTRSTFRIDVITVITHTSDHRCVIASKKKEIKKEMRGERPAWTTHKHTNTQVQCTRYERKWRNFPLAKTDLQIFNFFPRGFFFLSRTLTFVMLISSGWWFQFYFAKKTGENSSIQKHYNWFCSCGILTLAFTDHVFNSLTSEREREGKKRTIQWQMEQCEEIEKKQQNKIYGLLRRRRHRLHFFYFFHLLLLLFEAIRKTPWNVQAVCC